MINSDILFDKDIVLGVNVVELRLLRYFLAVAREENITRAAKALHIAQPSLSKQLMELEREFGKQLFIRGKRKITLTEEGILLYKRADEIISLCEKTKREISRDTNLIGGEISIGGGFSVTIARAVSNITAKYPNVKFQLMNGDAEKIDEYLEHGTVDFGILIEPVDITKYEHIPLGDSAIWGFLMRKDCPLAKKEAICPKDIENIPLIVPQRIGLQRQLSDWAGVEPQKLNIAATFDILFNSPALLIKNGTGYAFALNNLIDTTESKTLCFRPLDPPIKINYGLVWKRYPVFTRAAEKFVEEVKRCQSRGNT